MPNQMIALQARNPQLPDPAAQTAKVREHDEHGKAAGSRATSSVIGAADNGY
jgi:hypothetical protein